jgi:TonB family protein
MNRSARSWLQTFPVAACALLLSYNSFALTSQLQDKRNNQEIRSSHYRNAQKRRRARPAKSARLKVKEPELVITARPSSRTTSNSSPPSPAIVQGKVEYYPPGVSPPVRNQNAQDNPPPQKIPAEPINLGVLNYKAVHLPKPVYPPIAISVRASGRVVVQVTIDESGKVISARAISGHPLLQAAAVQAAYGARFSPTQLSGQPVKVTGAINYKFVL